MGHWALAKEGIGHRAYLTKYCRVRQPTAFTLAFGAIKLTHPTGLVSGLNA